MLPHRQAQCEQMKHHDALSRLIARSEANPDQPQWICLDCGGKRRYPGLDLSMHMDRCGWCGEIKAVAEPRDFKNVRKPE